MKSIRLRTLTDSLPKSQAFDRLRRAAIRRAVADGRLNVPVGSREDFPQAAVRFEKLGVDPATLAQFCREAEEELLNAAGQRLNVQPPSNVDK